MTHLFMSSLGERIQTTGPPVGTTVNPNDAFIWISAGQSNEKGQNGQVNSIAAQYQGVQNGNVWFGGFGSAGSWQKMESGVNNQNLAFGSPVDANWSLSFLKEMDDYIASLNGGVPGQTYLLQWPQGGSRLRVHNGANDWNASSSDLTGADINKREYLFQLANGVCGNGFNEFPAGKNIRIMGFTWRHGEADSNFNATAGDNPDWNPAAYVPDETTVLAAVKAQYKTDFKAMITAFANFIPTRTYESNNLTIDEMRLVISGMNPNASNVTNRPYYTVILEALSELATEVPNETPIVAADFMASNFTGVLGDGVHDDHTAQIQMGIDRFNHFKQFIS